MIGSDGVPLSPVQLVKNATVESEHNNANIIRHPALWSAVVFYAIWYRASARLTRRAGAWGPRWLAVAVARFFSWLMDAVGARLCTLKLPDRLVDGAQYVVCWHPHGAYTTMAFMHCGLQTVTKTPLTWFPGVAPMLFKLPLFREALLLLNARAVDGRTLEKLARSGLTVGIQPGGIAEQLKSDERREIALFHQGLGFVRLAMRRGTQLLPVYIFGENQVYHASSCAKLTQIANRILGVPLIFIRGRWGLPWLVPKRVDVHVCWGNPVSVGAATTDPTDEQVQEVFDRYTNELRRVFDTNKDACLPAHIAARGLTIVVNRKVEHRASNRPHVVKRKVFKSSL